jgi:hypothetical protein
MNTKCSLQPLAFSLSLAALALLSTFHPQPVSAVTFTTNATIAEANLAYDGQDIVVDGATLTVNGPHAFNSRLFTNTAGLARPGAIVLPYSGRCAT